ncbi:MAG: glycoside hydrolase family 127 protein [Clostridia bacterium]|nr:glycoside hydrolase family 127 protein [Clostridia bacterium]
MNRIEITEKELNERIALSHQRLSEPFYDIDNVFADIDAKWPGDKEGRALLAFVCLVNAGTDKIPCMELMIDRLPSMLNEKGYLGRITDEFFEQQLSGHSWLLRGLCEYYEKYGKAEILDIINGITGNLYMPLKGAISDYPLVRKEENNGGVDGHTSEQSDGWLLSTDTCCAFMSIDGLSHVYKLTRDEKIKALLDEMVDTFMKIDKREIKAQTHCTLTAARGMVRLYNLTGEEKYLSDAKYIFSIYVDYGMTYTYENYNWWGRPETWTEPCAIIDSLMLAGELYKITGDKQYRTYAARIFHNGFATLQRCNGGAGTQKIVCETRDILQISGFEAPQCCTMRLAEGLRYIKDNKAVLYAETTGEIVKDEKGIYRDGDIIYAETVGDEQSGLHPLIKYYKLTKDEIMNTQQRVVFK